MSAQRYEYALIVEEVDGGWQASINGAPLTGFSRDSPLGAVRQLCEVLAEWPRGGAERWLATPAGIALARTFVPGFTPPKAGGSA